MLKMLISRQISAFEENWNYDMAYMREVADLGFFVLKRFADAQKIGTYRAGISKGAHYGAKILAVMAGDCGPCVQLVVNMAVADGVAAKDLAALVAGRFEELPEDMRLPARFTRALLARNDELPELREQMRQTHGNAGLVSVAYAVINASMFPTLKYALGHGHACAKIEIGDDLVVPVDPRLERLHVA